MTPTQDPEGELPEDEELLAEELAGDDAAVARAFKVSLVLLAAIAVLALGGWWLLREKEVVVEEVTPEVVAPKAIDEEARAPRVSFRDVTGEAGIDFVHENGARGEKLLPETMGSGAAFFDRDQDGDPDLVFVNAIPWEVEAAEGEGLATQAYYENDGKGRFTDRTEGAGLDVSFYGTGVACGDADGDGRTDLFFAAVGANHLFLDGDERFREATAEAGLAGGDDQWSSSAGFFDQDNDGDLDLFVCNYIRWSAEIDRALDYRLTGVGRAYGPPTNFEGAFSYFYRNEGEGRFRDVSEESGVRVANPVTGKPAGKALGLAPVDVDQDGWIDLLVANDTVQNFLFLNQEDGTFLERGSEFGIAFDRNGKSTGAMGIDSARFRNDASLGFAIGNFANEMSSLYVSQESATRFADEALGEGIGGPTRKYLSFGLFFFDYDLDGRLDLLQANGHLEDEINAVQPSQRYEQPAQLFWNAGPDRRSTFAEIPPAETGDLARPIVGRGTAFADIDLDGDPDVLITQAGGAPLLLENTQETGHHWLRVSLRQEGPNPLAIGAEVELEVAGAVQRRSVMPTRSYLSQVESALTFGLGEATSVDRLRVRWPDGSTREVPADGIDRHLSIDR